MGSPFSLHRKLRRTAIFMMAAPLLLACQTTTPQPVPVKSPQFSTKQILELKKIGFIEDAITGEWNLNLDGQILFDPGTYTLKSQGIELIHQILKVLRMVGVRSLMVEGHTDNIGSPQKNLILSEKRAAVVSLEFARQGFPQAQILQQAFGETRPIASNKTAEGRAKNRRVTLIVIASAEGLPT